MSDEFTDEQIEDVKQALFAKAQAAVAEAERLRLELSESWHKLSATEQEEARPFACFDLPHDHLNGLQMKYMVTRKLYHVACQDDSFSKLMQVSRKRGDWKSIVQDCLAYREAKSTRKTS